MSEQIRKGLETIFADGQTIEVRAVGMGMPFIKRFNQKDAATKTLEALSVGGKFDGIYYVLNEIPMLLPGNGASDSDVTRRRWLFIDCDAIRPKNVSATDEEKFASLQVAETIKSAMMMRGWSEPTVADSGNGYHLLYPIDLENTIDTASLVKGVLIALGKLYSTDKVVIDPVVFNAARITKAYGTMVRKGDETPERPHRQSKIVSIGADEIVTRAQMQELVAENKAEPKPSELLDGGITSIEDAATLTPQHMEEFLLHCDVNHYAGDDSFMQNSKSGVRYVLEVCPWSEEHSGKDAPKDAAVFVLEDGMFGFNCFHSHCSERTWKDFRAKVSEGKKKFQFFDTGSITVGGKNKIEQVSDFQPAIKMRTMDEVEEEPLLWLWPGRIPAGSNVLFGGDPSRGKSLMAYDLIARLSVGADFIDGAKNETGACEAIILSCEDDPNTIIKPRLVLAGADCKKIHLLETVTDNTGERMLRIDKDITRIRKTLESHPAVRLVLIDPLSNYIGAADMFKDSDMRKHLTPLSLIARDYNVSFLIIMHNNKGKGLTGLQKIGGSLGAAGVARMGWAFYEDDEYVDTKVMLQIKENYGKFPGIKFTTVGHDRIIGGKTISVPRVEYVGATDTSANDLLAQQSNKQYNIQVKGKTAKEPKNEQPVHQVQTVPADAAPMKEDGASSE